MLLTPWRSGHKGGDTCRMQNRQSGVALGSIAGWTLLTEECSSQILQIMDQLGHECGQRVQLTVGSGEWYCSKHTEQGQPIGLHFTD